MTSESNVVTLPLITTRPSSDVLGVKFQPKSILNYNEVVEIPTFYNRDNMLFDKNMKLDKLKQIAKRLHLKSSGKKQVLRDRIYEYITQSHFAIYVQKRFRGFIQRKINRMRGPTFFKRSENVNACDFMTLEPMELIPYYQYFSFMDSDGFKYGFDISSIYHLFYNDLNTAKNPYNRNILDISIYRSIQDIIRLSKIYKHIETSVEIEISQISNEKKIQLRIIQLFQAINESGNYSDFKWFEQLNRTKLYHFMYEIMDIWNYRANLSIDDKILICPPSGDPFNGIPHILRILKSQNATSIRLREIVLTILEKFVYESFNSENRGLRVMYILTALTSVSNNAANSMPWLYDSLH
jgi:hypothetical protein